MRLTLGPVLGVVVLLSLVGCQRDGSAEPGASGDPGGAGPFGVSGSGASGPGEALPVLGQVTPFELTDQRGEPFGSEQLRGHVWVANFIFTRCPTICPVFSAQMARLQGSEDPRLEPLRFVSFSVDPDYDTPARLAAYAERFEADPARWTFLTGSLDAIEEAVVGGFKVHMGRDPDTDDVAGIFHGTHFVLVDRGGAIRGYYRSEDEDVLERIEAAAARLIAEEEAATG